LSRRKKLHHLPQTRFPRFWVSSQSSVDGRNWTLDKKQIETIVFSFIHFLFVRKCVFAQFFYSHFFPVRSFFAASLASNFLGAFLIPAF
jgi:hypothetical protein